MNSDVLVGAGEVEEGLHRTGRQWEPKGDWEGGPGHLKTPCPVVRK